MLIKELCAIQIKEAVPVKSSDASAFQKSYANVEKAATTLHAFLKPNSNFGKAIESADGDMSHFKSICDQFNKVIDELADLEMATMMPLQLEEE